MLEFIQDMYRDTLYLVYKIERNTVGDLQGRYSLESHLSAIQTYVESIVPVMPNVRIRNIVQPGLAKIMRGFCTIDMRHAVPADEEERLSSMEHLVSPGADDSGRFDTIAAPFYAAYVGYWRGEAPADLGSGTIKQANLAMDHLAARANTALQRASESDRNDGRNGYGEIISRYAGRLAVVRHHILRSAHPDRIPVAFPNLENDNVKR